MADRKKEGKTKIQKFKYLKNEKSFLDEIKFFIAFEGLSLDENNSQEKSCARVFF